MGIVRAHVERVEVVGLDEAYLDLAGLYSPRTAMRRLLAEIHAGTRLTCSVGIGPNKLVAKVASDAEKPAGFVVLTREQACARFASAPPQLVPGHRPEDREAPRRARTDTLALLAAAPEQLLVQSFGANLGRELQPTRALRTRRRGRRGAQGRLGVARADLRHRHRRSRAHARRARAHGRGAVRRPRGARTPGAHDRHQGPPATTSPRSRARARCPRPPARPRSYAASRCGCSTSTPRRCPCACWACAWPGSRRQRRRSRSPMAARRHRAAPRTGRRGSTARAAGVSDAAEAHERAARYGWR